MGRLHGKVVIVTGAVSEPGNALTMLIGKEGGKVTAADAQEAPMLELAKVTLHHFGWTSIGVKLDPAIEEDWVKVGQLAFSNFRQSDVLVNTAGIPGASRLADENAAAFNKKIEEIAQGNLLGIHVLASNMKEDGSRLVINVLADEELAGEQAGAAYAVVKATSRLLPESAAAFLDEQKLCVYSIFPKALGADFLGETFKASFDEDEPADGGPEHISFVSLADIPETIVQLIAGE